MRYVRMRGKLWGKKDAGRPGLNGLCALTRKPSQKHGQVVVDSYRHSRGIQGSAEPNWLSLQNGLGEESCSECVAEEAKEASWNKRKQKSRWQFAGDAGGQLAADHLMFYPVKTSSRPGQLYKMRAGRAMPRLLSGKEELLGKDEMKGRWHDVGIAFAPICDRSVGGTSTISSSPPNRTTSTRFSGQFASLVSARLRLPNPVVHIITSAKKGPKSLASPR
ncbi:hypothetical protein EJ06DRAFT_296042 [Trichodelitschia bisporula]|uniref:Uncharacterized protein n=1 Tax=Trichodelitschia bisporula TaxID=703511 RepID=A0A6G1I6E3_9PEZI|nr:hypothetical protein EJ06DRAFT_296042 [Trichodelitschia bisporula]